MSPSGNQPADAGRRRFVHRTAGAVMGLIAGAGTGGSVTSEPAVVAVGVPLALPADTVSLAGFGAQGRGAADDTVAIQSAIDALAPGQTLYIPSGIYSVSDTLVCHDRPNIRIVSPARALIVAAAGANLATRALLDLSGCDGAVLHGLRFNSRLAASHPATGLLLGRTSLYAGEGIVVRGCSFEGKYGVASVYNVGAENVVFDCCDLQSETANPVYWDSPTDLMGLTANGSTLYPNRGKTFIGCRLKNYAAGRDLRIVRLHRSQQAVLFQDCFFTFMSSPNSTCYVIDLWGDEPDAAARSLTLNNCRVEGPDQAESRFLYVNITNGLDRLSLINPTWTIRSDFYIELARDLTDSDLWPSSSREGYIRVGPGARLHGNRLYGGLRDKVFVDTGGVATGNSVFSTNGTPFRGPGTY